MPWRATGFHRKYYYRARWVNKKLTWIYIGIGPNAEREAAIDEQIREQRRAQREAKKAEQARLKAIDDQILAFIKLADLMAKSCLVAGGYRQHDGGSWRKRRLRA